MSSAQSTLSQLALAAAVQGLQTLAPARAMHLRPRRDGELHIVQGNVWATRNGPHDATAGGPQGDLILTPGMRLPLRAGETLVLEPIGLHGAPARIVAFDWCDAPRHPARWLHAAALWTRNRWPDRTPYRSRCQA